MVVIDLRSRCVEVEMQEVERWLIDFLLWRILGYYICRRFWTHSVSFGGWGRTTIPLAGFRFPCGGKEGGREGGKGGSPVLESSGLSLY